MAERDYDNRATPLHQESFSSLEFKQAAEAGYSGSRENVDVIPPEHWRVAADEYAADIRAIYVDFVTLLQRPQNQELQTRYNWFIEPKNPRSAETFTRWYEDKKHFYFEQNEPTADRYLLTDLAQMLDDAIDLIGERRALQQMQLARVKRAALGSAPPASAEQPQPNLGGRLTLIK